MRYRLTGFSAFEFVVVLIIISLTVLAILPSFEGTLKGTRETIVKQTALAMQESLKRIRLRYVAARMSGPAMDLPDIADGTLDLNQAGFPVSTNWQPHQQRPITPADCQALWYALLGGVPPSASITGDTDFRVQTEFDRQLGLGCLYRYRRGGDLAIRYFPDDGSVTADVRF